MKLHVKVLANVNVDVQAYVHGKVYVQIMVRCSGSG